MRFSVSSSASTLSATICRPSPGLAPERARGRPVDMARAFREKHEPDHVRAGVERGVERQGRGKAANFDRGRHRALLSVKAPALSKGGGWAAHWAGGSLCSGLPAPRSRSIAVDFALRRRPHLGFRVAVKRDDPPALVGQRRAAAFCAAVMGRNDGLGEQLVQFVDRAARRDGTTSGGRGRRPRSIRSCRSIPGARSCLRPSGGQARNQAGSSNEWPSLPMPYVFARLSSPRGRIPNRVCAPGGRTDPAADRARRCA